MSKALSSASKGSTAHRTEAALRFDNRALRVAVAVGLTVMSCPQLVKAWADATQPDPDRVVQVLTGIQTLAQFRPNPAVPEPAWWLGLV
jgi:hypothetical protein